VPEVAVAVCGLLDAFDASATLGVGPVSALEPPKKLMLYARYP